MNARRLTACFAVVLVAALSVGLVAATAKPTKSTATTVRVLFNINNQVPMQAMVENFKRQFPDIDIQANYLANDAAAALMNTTFPAGNAPDVVPTIAGDGDPLSARRFGKAGHLADLSKRPWAKRVLKLGRPFVSDGKKLYAWITSMTLVGVQYNKDIFARLNLKPPANFAAMLDLCRKLNAADLIPIAGPGSDFATMAGTGMTVAGTTVFGNQPYWDKLKQEGKVTFAGSATWRRGLQRIIEMKNADCYGRSYSPSAVTARVAATQFATGQSAMISVPSSGMSTTLSINPAMKWELFAFPTDQAKDKKINFQAAISLSVNARSPVLKEATTFVDFLARPKQSALWAELTVGAVAPFDANRGVFSRPELKKAGELYTAKRAVYQHQSIWPSPSVRDAFARGVQGLFTGQKTVEAILRDMDDAWPK